jgi:hypothetical protein
MHKRLPHLFLFSLISLIGCNTNRVVQFQLTKDSTSSIKIKPSTAIGNVVVLLDGNMVWEKLRTVKSLTIENVPKGDHILQVVSANWYYKNEIDIIKLIHVDGKGETKIELVSVPPFSSGYWMYLSVLAIVPWITYYAFWY